MQATTLEVTLIFKHATSLHHHINNAFVKTCVRGDVYASVRVFNLTIIYAYFRVREQTC
jgi:hypothetical protein